MPVREEHARKLHSSHFAACVLCVCLALCRRDGGGCWLAGAYSMLRILWSLEHVCVEVEAHDDDESRQRGSIFACHRGCGQLRSRSPPLHVAVVLPAPETSKVSPAVGRSQLANSEQSARRDKLKPQFFLIQFSFFGPCGVGWSVMRDHWLWAVINEQEPGKTLITTPAVVLD